MHNVILKNKELRRDLRQYYFAQLFNQTKATKIKLQAAKKIHRFVKGRYGVTPSDCDMMYTYLRTFGYIKHRTVTEDAYKGFDRLNWISSNNRPGILRRFQAWNYYNAGILSRRIAGIFHSTHKKPTPRPVPKASVSNPKKPSFFRRNKDKLIGLVILAGVLVGGGKLARQAHKSPQQNKIENFVPRADTTKTSAKTLTIEPQTAMSDTLAKIYKNYYDTALEIHLGTSGRDQLYNNLNNQIKEGRLSIPQDESMEHLAHTITVASLVQPNAENTILLQKAATENLSAQDQQQVWQLVSRAGDKGQNIKGSGTHSNFDNRKKELQKKHIKNLKQLQKYKARTGR